MTQFMRTNKQLIRQFMRNHYSDERLCALLAHAQSGKLAFHSCCCFIGCATADHALRPENLTLRASLEDIAHLTRARELTDSKRAEMAFLRLCLNRLETPRQLPVIENQVRRIRLIPIIKAELKRREAVRKEADNENRLQRMETRYPQLHADELQRRETSDALGACPEQLALL